jgi:hypothetical protein
MLWYNILNPRNWPGVTIKTGNNKIDGVYYNLLSSNQVSLAASGSMFLTANSGIKLISPSFVDTSGLRAERILAENYGRIDGSGAVIPLYSGTNSGIMVKLNDNTLYANNIITYDSDSDQLRFPSATDGSVVYIADQYINNGIDIPANKEIKTFPGIKMVERSTDLEGKELEPANINISVKTFANSGINIGPNNFLDSYKGFILTHDGSGNVAQWKPATYLRENYDDQEPLDGLERVGINWIRYPRRPALVLDGKLYIYQTDRDWSPYPAFTDIDQLKKELGTGSDTLCVSKSKGEAVVGYTKFAFVDKASALQGLNTVFNFDERIKETTVIDPDEEDPEIGEVPCWVIDIAPENPGGISDTVTQDETPAADEDLTGDIGQATPTTGGNGGRGSNVLLFSVTKGAYFPMQIEPKATAGIKLRDDGLIGILLDELLGQNTSSVGANSADCSDCFNGVITTRDDGTLLEEPISVNLGFKPSTLNNISIRPDTHTAFNMLGENIDFVIYGKEFTPFNTYDFSKFQLNENLLPTGLVPVFRVDAMIPSGVIGSPTGVNYSRFIDRAKTQPIGWNFDYSGKVCIKSNDSYELGSVPSGSGGFLKSYADVTISGHTYSTSLIAEDIFLKPIPAIDNTGKYIRNALLTLDGSGKIISRTPRINPALPGIPSGVIVEIFGNQACSISWVAPVNDGDSKILNYLIQASINGGESWLDIPVDNFVNTINGFSSQTSATIEPMDNLPGAIFRVAAQNAVGIGEYSESTENIYVNNLSAPKMPINLTYNRNIDSEILSDITLYWDWNQSFTWGNTASPSGFLIEESSFDGLTFSSFSGIALIEYDSGSTQYEHNETGLSGKDNYLYRISAVNSNSIISSYNYIYSTGLLMLDIDLEEEENKRTEELSNFDFGVIMFTGTCIV